MSPLAKVKAIRWIADRDPIMRNSKIFRGQPAKAIDVSQDKGGKGTVGARQHRVEHGGSAQRNEGARQSVPAEG
jgi:hypothetical protein